MTAVDPQELLTPEEVCALLKMKRTWFYAQVTRGVFQPIKLGRSTRVRRRDLEAYLAGLENDLATTVRPARQAQPDPPEAEAPGGPAPAAGRPSRSRSVQRSPAPLRIAARARHPQLNVPDRVG